VHALTRIVIKKHAILLIIFDIMFVDFKVSIYCSNTYIICLAIIEDCRNDPPQCKRTIS
jgi:hypothetical protein